MAVVKKADRKGPKVNLTLRLYAKEGRKLHSFRVLPATPKILNHLTKRKWGPNKGRVVDAITRRYYWHWIGNHKFPKLSVSTIEVIDLFVQKVKEGHYEIFPNLKLQIKPSRSRMLDYLADYWYGYEQRWDRR